MWEVWSERGWWHLRRVHGWIAWTRHRGDPLLCALFVVGSGCRVVADVVFLRCLPGGLCFVASVRASCSAHVPACVPQGVL